MMFRFGLVGIIGQCLASGVESQQDSLHLLQLQSQKHHNPVDPNSNCEGAHCLINQICANGTILDFNKGRMKTNNLGGMGPGGGPKEIYYGAVGNLGGRSVDCIVRTIGDTYYNANIRHQFRAGWYRMTGPQFIGKYNGVHTTSGAGVVGSLKMGEYSVTFNFVWSDDKTPATIPYLPLTFYDIDGFEQTSTCQASSAVVHNPTQITGSCNAQTGCCTHKGSAMEIRTPTSWEHLTARQKMGAVAYLFQDASTFKITYKTQKDHRIFIFKGSMALACMDKNNLNIVEGSTTTTTTTTTTTEATTTTTTTTTTYAAGTTTVDLGNGKPPPEEPTCENTEPLVFSTVSGDLDSRDGLRFPNVKSGIDLVVRTVVQGSYEAYDASNNGLVGGDFARINIKCGTDSLIEAITVASGTMDPMVQDSIALTVFDMDEGKRHKGRVSLQTCSHAGASFPSGTELSAFEDNGCIRVGSCKKGKKGNDPTSLSTLTDDHTSRSATLLFTNVAKTTFKLGVGAGVGGRNFQFAFAPTNACLPKADSTFRPDECCAKGACQNTIDMI